MKLDDVTAEWILSNMVTQEASDSMTHHIELALFHRFPSEGGGEDTIVRRIQLKPEEVLRILRQRRLLGP